MFKNLALKTQESKYTVSQKLHVLHIGFKFMAEILSWLIATTKIWFNISAKCKRKVLKDLEIDRM